MSMTAMDKTGWAEQPAEFSQMMKWLSAASKSNSLQATQKPPAAFANGIQFSRRFVVTYNILLGVLLLGFTINHHVRQYGRRRQQQQNLLGANTSSNLSRLTIHSANDSPGSSREATLTRTSPNGSITGLDERKPLLQTKTIKRNGATFYTRIQAIGEYQMPNILGTSMPKLSICLVILGITAVNVFYSLYKIPFGGRKVMVVFYLMDRFGLVFVMNLPLLYLLAAKNCPLKTMTGWSYEQLNVFHRAVARIVILSAILHFALMVWVWMLALRPAGITFISILRHFEFAAGLVAWSAFIFLAITSIRELRALAYELFLYIHIIFQAVAMGFLFFHHASAQIYVGIALGIWIVDRIVYRCYLKRFYTTCKISVLPDGTTARVTIDLRSAISEKDIVQWKTGDHFFLTIPAVSSFQNHPFSVASLPPPHSTTMDFIIRSQEGFSKRLLRASDSNDISLAAIIDGPYGSSHAMSCLDDSTTAVLIAGGSGIAAVYPLARETKLRKDNKRVVLVWIIHEGVQQEWLKPDEIQILRDENVEVTVYVTKGVARPDLREIVQDLVVDGDDESVGIVVCGPDGMIRDVRNTVARLLWKGYNVGLVSEKYGW